MRRSPASGQPALLWRACVSGHRRPMSLEVPSSLRSLCPALELSGSEQCPQSADPLCSSLLLRTLPSRRVFSFGSLDLRSERRHGAECDLWMEAGQVHPAVWWQVWAWGGACMSSCREPGTGLRASGIADWISLREGSGPGRGDSLCSDSPSQGGHSGELPRLQH